MKVLPPIRGSQPEVIRSWCAHHPPPKVFAGRLNARGTRTRLPRRAGGGWPARRRPARDLGAAATPIARRPLAIMSHRTGAPIERGGGGGSKVLAVCHPTLALGRSSKHALHRASRVSAQHTTSSTSPLPPGDNVRSYYAGGTCRRPGAQRPRLRRRARNRSARQ